MFRVESCPLSMARRATLATTALEISGTSTVLIACHMPRLCVQPIHHRHVQNLAAVARTYDDELAQ
jgi:hypothetical protein